MADHEENRKSTRDTKAWESEQSVNCDRKQLKEII